MPPNKKGPAGTNRWAFYKIKLTYPIVPSLPSETKHFLRRLAFVYHEAVTSEGPRAMWLGLQLHRRHLGKILRPEAL